MKPECEITVLLADFELALHLPESADAPDIAPVSQMASIAPCARGIVIDNGYYETEIAGVGVWARNVLINAHRLNGLLGRLGGKQDIVLRYVAGNLMIGNLMLSAEDAPMPGNGFALPHPGKEQRLPIAQPIATRHRGRMTTSGLPLFRQRTSE